MKQVIVVMRFTSGTISHNRISLDATTGQLTLPGSLLEAMAIYEKTEMKPSITIEDEGWIYGVVRKSNGVFIATNEGARKIKQGPLGDLLFPNRAQRQMNGRFAHLLGAMALLGATLNVVPTPIWIHRSSAETVSFVISALLLGITGLYCKAD